MLAIALSPLHLDSLVLLACGEVRLLMFDPKKLSPDQYEKIKQEMVLGGCLLVS